MRTLIQIATAAVITIGVASATAAADGNKYLTFGHGQQRPFGDGRAPGSSSTGPYNPGGSAADWELAAFGRFDPRAHSDLIPDR